jgi:hypothetical protein
LPDAVAKRNRRIGALSVVSALTVVLIWWTVIVPRTPQYKAYKREARLKATLGNLAPPTGSQLVNVWIVPMSDRDRRYSVAMGSYTTKSPCATVEAHYKAEFVKHGFVYKGEETAAMTHGRQLSFSSQDYDATLSCPERDRIQLYFITMSSKT